MNVVDLFAGGGGASEGIRLALGIAPTVAVNHDPAAIEMHAANHPGTMHLCEDVFKVTPFRPNGKPIDLLWASPDCTHHSRARGGKPRSTGRRLLAWVIVEWARSVHPRVIALENVQEFQDWGPLDEHDQPIPARKGETFREFVSALRITGYRVEWRVLNAADFGAPTSRRRLVLLARCDGEAIRWPEPSHGPGRAHPWRTAAEIIDWSLPCPSIFERTRPLAEATERRIAEGIRRYVLTAAKPFVIAIDHKSAGVQPVWSASTPVSTITRENRHALVAPTLIQTGYGERAGQAPRVLDLSRPLGTVTAVDHHSPVTAMLSPSANAQLTNAPKVAAFLCKYYGTGGQHQGCGEPLHTVPTVVDRFGLVTVTIDGEAYVLADIGLRMLQPRELANAQGFGPEYILTGNKREQVARIGNSVCPPVAAAVVAAQFGREPFVAAA